MPISWNNDREEDLPLIAANAGAALTQAADHAQARQPPTVAMAAEWHRLLFTGVTLPVAYYAGEFRDADPKYPELYGYEVRVGNERGVASANVLETLARFEQAMQQAVAVLDPEIPSGSEPTDTALLRSVLTLCAAAHGEWVRIHPFANGNGRTARIWANWVAIRYGLPAFVRLHPRPLGDRYAAAAERSMRGNHGAMVLVFEAMLDAHLG